MLHSSMRNLKSLLSVFLMFHLVAYGLMYAPFLVLWVLEYMRYSSPLIPIFQLINIFGFGIVGYWLFGRIMARMSGVYAFRYILFAIIGHFLLIAGGCYFIKNGHSQKFIMSDVTAISLFSWISLVSFNNSLLEKINKLVNPELMSGK